MRYRAGRRAAARIPVGRARSRRLLQFRKLQEIAVAAATSVGVDVPDDPQVCNLENCRNDDAAAEAQRGLVTPLESDTRGKEEACKSLRASCRAFSPPWIPLTCALELY